MATTTLYELRAKIEQLLTQRIDEVLAGKSASQPQAASHVIVTVTPYDDIAVMIISPAFEGQPQQDRDAIVWSALEENLDPGELGLLSRWEVLTPGEARLMYPSVLKRRQPEVIAA